MLGLALTILIWSSNNIVGKIIMREASPLLVALMRFTLAGILFYLPVFLLLHRGEQRFARSDWLRLIFLGTVGTTGSLVLFLNGLRTTPATDAAIYQLTSPVFVVGIAWLLFRERLSRERMVGLAISLLGALLLVTGGGALGLGGGELAGALLIMGCNLTWSLYTVISKEILARRSPLLVLAAANLVAAVAIWPIAALSGTLEELPAVLGWSTTAWLIMVYLIAFMSTSSQWLYVRCLREVPASQAAAFNYLTPLFTAVQAALLLGERPTPLTIGAGLLTLAGLGLMNRPRPRATHRPARRANHTA
jgi:drug/metabolite transporter (DMT)-like permease